MAINLKAYTTINPLDAGYTTGNDRFSIVRLRIVLRCRMEDNVGPYGVHLPCAEPAVTLTINDLKSDVSQRSVLTFLRAFGAMDQIGIRGSLTGFVAWVPKPTDQFWLYTRMCVA